MSRNINLSSEGGIQILHGPAYIYANNKSNNKNTLTHLVFLPRIHDIPIGYQRQSFVIQQATKMLYKGERKIQERMFA